MKDYYSVKINFKGGIVSPQYLKNILTIAENANVSFVKFGLRQQMFLHVPISLSQFVLEKFKENEIDFEINTNKFPNILSSFVVQDVFKKSIWLSEAVYNQILASFDYEPRLKINISDNQQSFTPYFSGHLNFIASDAPNYWYLSVRLPKTNQVHSYFRLISSDDMAKVSKTLEDLLFSENNFAGTIENVWQSIPQNIVSPEVEIPLALYHFTLPYFEGFNRFENKIWLGIYRRDELFSIEFLKELCDTVQKANINEICLTTWKSLIIKGINEDERSLWNNLLAKHNINVRHAANELNWQIEDDSENALKLKLEIIDKFNQQDLRTHGICFGIKTIPKTEVFASIMVRRRRWMLLNKVPLIYVYDISYTEDFDPNGRTKIYFAQSVPRFNLVELLRRSVLFYNKKSAENLILKIDNPIPNEEKR